MCRRGVSGGGLRKVTVLILTLLLLLLCFVLTSRCESPLVGFSCGHWGNTHRPIFFPFFIFLVVYFSVKPYYSFLAAGFLNTHTHTLFLCTFSSPAQKHWPWYTVCPWLVSLTLAPPSQVVPMTWRSGRWETAPWCCCGRLRCMKEGAPSLAICWKSARVTKQTTGLLWMKSQSLTHITRWVKL